MFGLNVLRSSGEGVIRCRPSTLFVFLQYRTSTGLPDVPRMVAISDSGKMLTVEWTTPAPPEVAAAGHVTYVLQERHHVGAEYVPERMTAWTTVVRTDRTREQLKQPYAPGRWYQFRVAAINENGTKGYSVQSDQFFVHIGSRK